METQKTAKKAKATEKGATAKRAPSTGLSAAERQAVKDRAKELKAAKKGAEAEQAVLETIAALSDAERPLAERVHALIKEAAPELAPRTWYGMPAYAKDGKVICFFKAASKFDVRYAELGFSEPANLDDGNMWPTAFAVVKLTAAEEARIKELVRQAAS